MSLLITLTLVWKLPSGVKVVFVLGWEHLVPVCRAVKEQRQSVTTDHTNFGLEAAIRSESCFCVGVGASGSRL